MTEKQIIKIPEIELNWSDWIAWAKIGKKAYYATFNTGSGDAAIDKLIEEATKVPRKTKALVYYERTGIEIYDSIEQARAKLEKIKIPGKPGVYEVKYQEEEKRLYIGKALNLMSRVRDELVRGYRSHDGGRMIRQNEEISRVVIRWARTDASRIAAVEEDLHFQHVLQYHYLPKYVKKT